jgi:hypothetical protein
MKRLLLASLLVTTSVTLVGCRPDNPYKASTWTKQLDDAKSIEQATTWLENLGDPSAIPALGAAWEKQAHPVRLLQAMIALSRPLTPKQAETQNYTDFVASGRVSSWKETMKYLIKAVSEVDDTNAKSVDNAVKAADAIGESGLDEGLDALIEFSQRATSKTLLSSQMGAIRSIGKFGATQRGKVIAALTKILEKEGPPHPKTVADTTLKKAAGEKFEQYLKISSAAVNALGDLRTSDATKVLLVAMYRSPELFTSIRRALVASGAGVEGELRKIIRGEHAEVNAFIADKHLDKYCGDHSEYPPDKCVAVAGREYYASIVLGDFYNPQSATDLLNVLKQPPAPSYIYADQPGPLQHNAVFDALRKIGAAEGADVLKAIWTDTKADVNERMFAMTTYAFVARDASGVDALVKIADDNAADENLRKEAATAVARLAVSDSAVGALERLADKYAKASAEAKAKADGQPKIDYDKAKAVFDAANKVLVDLKAKATALSKDKSLSTEALEKAVADIKPAIKAAETTFAAAKAEEQKFGLVYKPMDREVKDYRGYQRMFQTQIARMEIAIRCADNISCYADALKQPPDGSTIAPKLGKYIKDIASWTEDEKKLLFPAQIERAMLELGKRGARAADQTDLLLDNTVANDRLIRQSILLALPKIAKVPCDKCEDKLQAAIKAGEGKSTLAELNVETQMLRNYFSWAGGKTAAKAEAAEAPPAK